MISQLCPEIPSTFLEAQNKEVFFTEPETDALGKLEALERSETSPFCREPLYFGFFFDGTKNNYMLGAEAKNQSNVARLYDCFPGLSAPGILPDDTNWEGKPKPCTYTNFYRTYIPGVASAFKQIRDTGKGMDLTFGPAFGQGGEMRIAWALVEAINNVHRHFYKDEVLISPSEALTLCNQLDLSAWHRKLMGAKAANRVAGDTAEMTAQKLGGLLKRLHRMVAPHWTNGEDSKPAKLDPPTITVIHVSVFGFSRGATQARAFSGRDVE